MHNEKYEPLGKGIKVLVNNIHKFNTDTILLANFANAYKSKKAVDLGSGCGTIPLIWAKEKTPNNIVAVEIQKDGSGLLKKSLAYNKLEDRITVINEDLRSLKGVIPFGVYDLVVCNPPYKHMGSGIINPNNKKAKARHETRCTLNDIISVASSLLHSGGNFCICQRPERLTDILETMRQKNLEPKRIRFVQQRQNKESKLVLVEGKKCGKKGGLRIMPTLFIEDETGNFSKEMINIYGDYRSDIDV